MTHKYRSLQVFDSIEDLVESLRIVRISAVLIITTALAYVLA